ncbi:MAG: hypothetical protein ACFFD1_05730 [Candidatus Thorarchaeota archaeon]
MKSFLYKLGIILFLLLLIPIESIYASPQSDYNSYFPETDLNINLTINFPYKPAFYTTMNISITGRISYKNDNNNQSEAFRVIALLFELTSENKERIASFEINSFDLNTQYRFNQTINTNIQTIATPDYKKPFTTHILIQLVQKNGRTINIDISDQRIINMYYEFLMGTFILDLTLLALLVVGIGTFITFIVDTRRINHLINSYSSSRQKKLLINREIFRARQGEDHEK